MAGSVIRLFCLGHVVFQVESLEKELGWVHRSVLTPQSSAHPSSPTEGAVDVSRFEKYLLFKLGSYGSKAK